MTEKGFKKKERKRKFISREDIQNIFDELEFSSALLQPPSFKIIPIKISFRSKDNRFSGLVVKYKEVIGFVPRENLQNPLRNLENSQKLMEARIPILAYFLRFEERQNLFAPRQRQTPIFSMFQPN